MPNISEYIAQFSSNQYGAVWLALATIAYAGDGSDSTASAAVTAAIAALPTALPGIDVANPSWVLEWGPVDAIEVDENNAPVPGNANLMYAVSYRDGNGNPLFLAIGIRGTDTHEKYQSEDLLEQLFEDLEIGSLVSWDQVAIPPTPLANVSLIPSSTSPMPAAIAKGTYRGLVCLLTMESALPGQAPTTLPAFLKRFARTYPDAPIVVTGHSLGGCQTTVLALLSAQYLSGATVISHPFAPPSAGTAAWNALYQAQFAPSGNVYGQIWWNVADVVPNVFQTTANPQPNAYQSLMTNLPLLWNALPYYTGPNGGGLTPDVAEMAAYELFRREAQGAYLHLANSMPASAVQALPGTYQAQSGGWLAQLVTQHFTHYYYQLVSAADGVLSYPEQNVSAG
jgi:pimeloyl-ACP methyl ester carboxylesterase